MANSTAEQVIAMIRDDFWKFGDDPELAFSQAFVERQFDCLIELLKPDPPEK